MPITPAGTAATRIFDQSPHVSLFSAFDLEGAKGFSRLKYSTTIAIMEPNWITTSNILTNCSLSSMLKKLSSKIKCPVELMGSHSVIP